MHYVIGDIHGCYDDMLLLINKINNKDPEAVFLFLGDFLDRGPKILETAKWMMAHISKDGKYQCIMGNHEEMAISWYYNKYLTNSSPILPVSRYDFHKTAVEMESKELEQLVQFLESLPLYKMIHLNDTLYCIVHAWYDEKKMDTNTLLWERKENNVHFDGIIIHGHTPTVPANNPAYKRYGMIHYGTNAINMDGGCYMRYRHPNNPYPFMLCGLCLETREEIYPEEIRNRFKTEKAYELYKKNCLNGTDRNEV